jgi:hypothetical protein
LDAGASTRLKIKGSLGYFTALKAQIKLRRNLRLRLKYSRVDASPDCVNSIVGRCASNRVIVEQREVKGNDVVKLVSKIF